jgi:hypothetical protein
MVVLIQQCIKLVDFSLSVTFTLVLLVVGKARRLTTLRVEPHFWLQLASQSFSQILDEGGSREY